MYEDVAEAIKACVMDVQFIGPYQGKKAIVEARDAFCGYPEAEALSDVNSKNIRDFVMRIIILRHGMPLRLRVDGGPENKGELIKMIDDLMIDLRIGSPYTPQSQGLVEVGHIPIAKALSIMTKGLSTGWTKALPFAIFADQNSIRPRTGYSPFFLAHGYHPILPFESAVPTWRILKWEPNMPRE
ncbi:hypothetical protein G7054_g14529 [Neopestalotiopsis clavispora]|nr:hypothetical protein G7054_g14529 [Neopestalotiopsis clavispora]